MKEFLVESWHWTTPDDRESDRRHSWAEADELARALAADGIDCAIYRLEATYMGMDCPPWKRCGVRPGKDFPATLGPGRVRHAGYRPTGTPGRNATRAGR